MRHEATATASFVHSRTADRNALCVSESVAALRASGSEPVSSSSFFSSSFLDSSSVRSASLILSLFSSANLLTWYESWLDRGFHIAATGGSDSHWISTSSLQGVGQPTTWVFASGRSADVAEGVGSFLEKRPPNFTDKVSDGLPDVMPGWASPEFA